jgi:hypothetical protein
MLERKDALLRIRKQLRDHRVVAIIGARQVGKTTLAREIAKNWPREVHYFDLEDRADRALFDEPMLALHALRGLVIIDEVQRAPDLFESIRVLADRPRPARRFLVLGSASGELLRQSAETLAGRIVYHRLAGFDVSEVGMERRERLWVRGGFPRSFLARSDAASGEWRRAFVSTFLERDVPQLGVRVPAAALGRFWAMIAHYHGQTWNSSEIAGSLGVSDHTVRRYLDILTSTLVLRQLAPWHENLRKRQVKAPKVYFTDSGLLHTMLEIGTRSELLRHPKLGASWEGFAMDAVISRLGARENECFFWSTHGGAEVDLLVLRGDKRFGFEFKRTDRPRMTRSMTSALADLRLRRLDVIHGGQRTFPLGENTRAVAFERVLDDLTPLK